MLKYRFFAVGDASQAKTLLNQLMKLGYKLDDALVASLISSFAKQQRLIEAQEVFFVFSDSPANEKLFNSMLDAYVKCGKPEEAYSLYKQVTERGHGPGAVAISIVVNALSHSGMTPWMTSQIFRLHKLQKFMHLPDYGSENMFNLLYIYFQHTKLVR